MSSLDGPLTALSRVLADDLAAVDLRRGYRRVQYDSAVRDTVTRWREGTGYKLGHMIDERAVARHFGSVMGAVVERQLMMLVEPMLLTAQSIERSLHHITIFASPSGNGPERYAPKPRGTMPHQIRTGVSR